MALKLLATADLHLGRNPSRLPAALADRARAFGPAAAWRRCVDLALEASVDAVVLVGDVVEHESDFYEAYRELSGGVERLAAAGVALFGVVGNHDVQVLPRLAAQIPQFRLLGRGGEWQAAEIEAGGQSLTLWGWSFPRPRVAYSPLAGVRFDRRSGPNIGLLHCDREQTNSPYAPVSRVELAAAGLDGWLLGHVHAPDRLTVDQPSGYLGAPVGTDPGEPGAHGPWLLTVDDGRLRAVEQWPLAPLRWEAVALDLSAVAEAEEVRVNLLEAVRALDAELAAGRPEAVGLRVTLTGRSALGGAALALFGDEEREHLLTGEAGSHYFIERLRVATLPQIDLEELAAASDPPGLLARRLLLLERRRDDPERRALVGAMRRRLEEEARSLRWQGLTPEPPDDEATVEWIRQAATRLLERMLAQRDGARESWR